MTDRDPFTLSCAPNVSIKAKFGNGKIISDDKKIDCCISQWHLLRPLLIALPNTQAFMPVMLIENYRQKAFNNNKSKMIFMIVYSMLMSFFFTSVYFINQNEKALELTFIGLILTCYFTFEYHFISNNINIVTNRSILVTNTYLDTRGCFLLWLVFLFLVGLWQLLLNYRTGSFEESVFLYGGIYEEISQGDWWRLLSASFFHSGIAHWLINAVSILMVAPLFKMLVGSYGISVFILGCFVGAASSYMTFILGDNAHNAYAGLSGGFFSLIGYIAIFSHKFKRDASNGLFFSFINFLIMSILLSHILAPSISNIAHCSSFLVGATLTIFQKPKINKNDD